MRIFIAFDYIKIQKKNSRVAFKAEEIERNQYSRKFKILITFVKKSLRELTAPLLRIICIHSSLDL